MTAGTVAEQMDKTIREFCIVIINETRTLLLFCVEQMNYLKSTE